MGASNDPVPTFRSIWKPVSLVELSVHVNRIVVEVVASANRLVGTLGGAAGGVTVASLDQSEAPAVADTPKVLVARTR